MIHKRKTYFLLLLITIGSLLSCYSVFAGASSTTSLEIKPGVLSLTPSHNLITLNYNEKDKVATASLGSLTITDATGSSHGWRVTVEASPIMILDENKTYPKLLQQGALSIHTQDAKIEVGEGSGEPPSWTSRNEIPINEGRPVTLLSAAVDQGLGTYIVSFGNKALKLNLPDHHIEANRTYQSVLTWTIQQGP